MSAQVTATPRNFPRSGALTRNNTALLVIDMQADFLSAGGYMDRAGADMEFLSSCIAPAHRVLDRFRRSGFRIAHTREGFSPDLTNVQSWKMAPSKEDRLKIGDAGPLGRALIEGEPGWQILPEFQPLPGEPIFDKNTYSAFSSTAIEQQLRSWQTSNLILIGVTTDCCITGNLRDALDRDFDCLVLQDCVAAGSREAHEAALTLIKRPSGPFGQISTSDDLMSALNQL